MQVFVFFYFGFACFKFSWFFLFDVLCRCNLSRFYITFIVSMSFFFSFLGEFDGMGQSIWDYVQGENYHNCDLLVLEKKSLYKLIP